MRFLHRPRRRQPGVVAYTEPAFCSEQPLTDTALPADRRAEDTFACDVTHTMSADSRERNVVLELIGTDGIAARLQPDINDDPATASLKLGKQTRADDLIETLHAQYWRALADPQVSLTGAWVAQPYEAHTGAASSASVAHEDRHTHTSQPQTGSIEVLILGVHQLEDFFGPLETGTPPDLKVESAPEILRLFAPPEYHAAAVRRAHALLPALTRREHHALTVDSPLAALPTQGYSANTVSAAGGVHANQPRDVPLAQRMANSAHKASIKPTETRDDRA